MTPPPSNIPGTDALLDAWLDVPDTVVRGPAFLGAALHVPDPTRGGSRAPLDGLRLLVMGSSAGAAMAVARALAELGGTVATLEGEGPRVSAVSGLDPHGLIVCRGDGEVHAAWMDEVRSGRRMRWATVVDVPIDTSGGGAEFDLAGLVAQLASVGLEDRAVAERLRAAADTAGGVAPLGAARWLRTLTESPGTWHADVRGEGGEFRVDVAEGLVVGATGRTGEGELVEGIAAIAAWLALATGEVRVLARSHPAALNVMMPVDEVLSVATALAGPEPRVAQAPGVTQDQGRRVADSGDATGRADEELEVSIMRSSGQGPSDGAGAAGENGPRPLVPRPDSVRASVAPSRLPQGIFGGRDELDDDARTSVMPAPVRGRVKGVFGGSADATQRTPLLHARDAAGLLGPSNAAAEAAAPRSVGVDLDLLDGLEGGHDARSSPPVVEASLVADDGLDEDLAALLDGGSPLAEGAGAAAQLLAGPIELDEVELSLRPEPPSPPPGQRHVPSFKTTLPYDLTPAAFVIPPPPGLGGQTPPSVPSFDDARDAGPTSANVSATEPLPALFPPVVDPLPAGPVRPPWRFGKGLGVALVGASALAFLAVIGTLVWRRWVERDAGADASSAQEEVALGEGGTVTVGAPPPAEVAPEVIEAAPEVVEAEPEVAEAAPEVAEAEVVAPGAEVPEAQAAAEAPEPVEVPAEGPVAATAEPPAVADPGPTSVADASGEAPSASQALVDRADRAPAATGEPLYRRALELDPRNHYAMLGLARILLARGDAREAIPLAEGAVRRRPRRAPYHVFLGDVRRAAGDAAGATAAWEAALERDPGDRVARARLGR